jgi:transposase-like protein
MRVQMPTIGGRRTLEIGQRILPEQIVRRLRQAEGELASGSTVAEVARELGISEATYHRWKNQYSRIAPVKRSASRSWRTRTSASRSFSPKRSWT